MDGPFGTFYAERGDLQLTLNVELDVSVCGIPEPVVGGAHVVAGVVPRHRGEREAEPADEILARWHLEKNCCNFQFDDFVSEMD